MVMIKLLKNKHKEIIMLHCKSVILQLQWLMGFKIQNYKKKSLYYCDEPIHNSQIICKIEIQSIK